MDDRKMAASLRTAFTRQPFQFLLIDIGSLQEMAVINICKSLSEVMVLCCSIRGSSRIPVFGLAAIGESIDHLLPLQPAHGNYTQISKAISRLNALAKNSSFAATNIRLLKQCLEDVVGEFNAFKEKVKKS